MPKYDFHTCLDPERFEYFACAMMNIRENITFQRFGAGMDNGIDGLYCSDNRKVVLQAKRVQANKSKLLSILRLEVLKAERINVDRYILVLSKSISDPSLKEEILKIFHGIIKDSHDIVTSDDLNGYLENPLYKGIEQAYPELWFKSSNILIEMLYENLNRATIQKMKGYLRRIEESVKVFVPTSFYYNAIKILQENKYVMLSGEPGVGKTANAYNLAHYFIVHEGYEQIYVVENIEEIYQLIDYNKKQFFILDDFWGRIRFSRSHLEINWEKKLIHLLEDIKNLSNSLLVITTREFVLQQGLRHYSEIEDRCNTDKVLINVEGYTLNQKVEILFRHVYESNLAWDFVHLIYLWNQRIVKHPNYTPRIVSYFCNNVTEDGKDSYEYFAELEDFLKEPYLYWEETFKQLSNGAKYICFALALSEEKILILELEESFLGIADKGEDEIDKAKFDSYLKELEDMFIAIDICDEEISGNKLTVDFINHSLRDFVEEYIQNNIKIYEKTFVNGLKYFNQLNYMIYGNPFGMTESAIDAAIQRIVDEIDLLKFSYIYNIEMDWNHYTVQHNTIAYRSHKIWLLMLIFRERKNKVLNRFLSRFADSVCKGMADKEVWFGYKELISIAEIMPEIYKCGIQFSVETFIKGYYSKAEYVQQYYYMDFCSNNVFGEVYKLFREENINKIRLKIKELVFEDIEYLYDEDEDIELFIHMLPDIFEQFQIEYTDKYKYEVYEAAFMDWEEDSMKEKTQHVFKDVGEVEDAKKYEDYLEEIRPWLLGENEVIDEDEIFHLIEISSLPESQKKDFIAQKECCLWYEAFTRDDFCSVLDYLFLTKSLPSNIHEFYKGFSEYLENNIDHSFDREQICQLAKMLIKYKQDVFTGNLSFVQTWENNDGEKFLDILCESGIIHKNGKWISFMNENLMYYYGLWHLTKEDIEVKRIFYDDQLMEIIYKHNKGAELALYFARDLDVCNFHQVVIEQYIDDFLKIITVAPESMVIKEFIKEVDMSVTIKNLECSGMTISLIPIIAIVETVQFNLIDAIWDDLESFCQKVIYDNYQYCVNEENEIKINVYSITSILGWYDIMCQHGLQENLLHFYFILKESKKMLKENNYHVDLFSYWKKEGMDCYNL